MIVNERLSVQLQSEDGLIELAHRIARKTGGHITVSYTHLTLPTIYSV